MSRDEFVERWKVYLTGMALYGVVTEATGGPLTRAARAHEIPANVESLLKQMYDEFVKSAATGAFPSLAPKG